MRHRPTKLSACIHGGLGSEGGRGGEKEDKREQKEGSNSGWSDGRRRDGKSEKFHGVGSRKKREKEDIEEWRQ